MMSDSKIERERAFHNQRFSQDIHARAHLDKWYAACRHGPELQSRLLLETVGGKDVLDYGCGEGLLSVDDLMLPGRCRSFTGIDISERRDRNGAQPRGRTRFHQHALHTDGCRGHVVSGPELQRRLRTRHRPPS